MMLRKLCSSAIRNVMGTISSVSTGYALAALTFDDGPNPEVTPQLLDILESHNARATFFMVGRLAHRHQDLVKRIADAGHAIGNHTWDHPSLPFLTGRERRKQIRACGKAIAPYGQRLFRPPYGHQSRASHLDAFLLGYDIVTWDVVAEDYLGHNAEVMSKRVISKIRPGSVVLFHDSLCTLNEERFADREPTLKVVSMLLERLGDWFNFVTVPELLKLGRPERQNWYVTGDQDWLNGLKNGTI